MGYGWIRWWVIVRDWIADLAESEVVMRREGVGDGS
jgi:hypothetical protein